MITEHLDGDGNGYILLRPNQSASWQESLWFYGTLGGVSFLIAVGFAWAGLWLILPFAGLEVLALGGAVYWVSGKSNVQQVIRFEPDTLSFEEGVSRPEQRWSVNRAWARFHVIPAPHYAHPQRVRLVYGGDGREVGAFLNEEERSQLIFRLRALKLVRAG